MEKIKDANPFKLMHMTWEQFEFYQGARSFRTEYAEEVTVSEHVHDFAQLIYCEKGSFSHVLDGKETKCTAGMLSITPPGKNHHFTVYKGSHLVYINMAYNVFNNLPVKKFPLVATLALLAPFSPLISFEIPQYLTFGKNKKEAEALLAKLPNLQQKNAAQFQKVCEEFLSCAFSMNKNELAEAEFVFNGKLLPIINSLDYLNTSYPQKIHCDDILRVVFLCQTDFYKYFKLFTGTTYSLYLQMVRVSRAHRAIAFTPYSLSYIANMCGFGDHAYMTKCYKKYIDITPSERRAMCLRNNPEFFNLMVSHDFFGTSKW